MITPIIVPDVGATGGGVRLAAWLAKEGDHVAEGTPLFTLETDKATQDIEAFQGGYLRKLLVPVDSEVDIGTVVALLSDSADEPLEEKTAPAKKVASPHQPGNLVATPERTGPLAGKRGRILASPVAKRLARARHLDLAAIAGSGPQGQIHKRDVLKAWELGSSSGKGRRVSLSPMRRAVARRMQLGKAEVPHFYAGVTIDVTELLALRSRLAEESRSEAPSINDFIVLAAARALRQTPALNASFQGEEILYYDKVAIGVAMAVMDSVVAPVVAGVEQLDLWSLSAAVAELRKRAEAGRLAASDLAGGALTVSNLGMHGVDRFTAIINPPQAAVLAVGAARAQPAVHRGTLTIRTLMEVNLSVDHRVADGVVAGKFLNELRRLLESPEMLTGRFEVNSKEPPTQSGLRPQPN